MLASFKTGWTQIDMRTIFYWNWKTQNKIQND